MPVFKELRINVEFYQLSDGLRIDAEEIRDKTSIGETILFVINYFGFPADWELVNTLKVCCLISSQKLKFIKKLYVAIFFCTRKWHT